MHTVTVNTCPSCHAALPPVDDAYCPDCYQELEAAEFDYLPKYGDSQPEENCSSSEMPEEPSLSWKAGDRVLAPWEACYLYAGTIDQVAEDQAHIAFDDGDCGWVQTAQLRALEISPGQHVFARWKMGPRYSPGGVKEVDGTSVLVSYDNGDEERTTFAALRIACIPTGPGAYPTEVVNGPGFWVMAMAAAVAWLVQVGVVTAILLLGKLFS